MWRQFSVIMLLALVPANDGAGAQRATAGTIAGVTAQPLAVVNQSVSITVRTRGPCALLKLEFGDGTSATSTGAAVAAKAGGTFFYSLTHSYSTPGNKTVTATGTTNCVGQATAVVDVAAGPAAQGGAPVMPPPAFSLLSVSYSWFGEIVAKAAADTVKVPYPSGPSLSNNTTVVFSFRPRVPAAMLSALDETVKPGQPLCNPKIRGPCPFKFSLTHTDGDPGMPMDKSAVATRTSAWDGSYILEIHIPNLDIRELFKDHARYALYMEMQYQGNTYATKQIIIERGSALGNYFERVIYPTFQSDRCTTCHSMGDHDAIVKQHALHSVLLDKIGGSDPEVQPGQTALCANCHRPPHVTDWRTPPFSKGINWKEMKSALEVCRTVIAHLQVQGALVQSSQTLAELKDNLRNHFHSDPRVKWAISDAFAVATQLVRAQPQSWDTWLEIINPWIALDDHCHVD